MAERKKFNTRKKTEIPEFEITDEAGTAVVFKMKPSIPGAILLDFISGANTEDPGAMARTVNNLLNAAIADEDAERWAAFIRDPKNDVTLEVLSEIAGYASEILSGGNEAAAISSNG